MKPTRILIIAGIVILALVLFREWKKRQDLRLYNEQMRQLENQQQTNGVGFVRLISSWFSSEPTAQQVADSTAEETVAAAAGAGQM